MQALVLLLLFAVACVIFDVPIVQQRWTSRQLPRWRIHWPAWLDEPAEQLTWAIRFVATVLLVAGFLDLFVLGGQTIYHSFTTEMIGVAVTVLVLEELDRLRSKQEFKQQTFRQIRHSSNPFAVEALETARAMGWMDEIIHPDTDLKNANLAGADLRHASLQRAKFWEANLVGTDLRGANLIEADLRYANLAGAYLRGANLAGANLWGANLDGAELGGITYSSTTKWPKRFDPEFRGAILVR